MRILIINTSDVEGGAAKAAYRLHKGLLSAGYDSKMIVLNKYSNDYTVIDEQSKYIKMLNKFRAFYDSIPIRKYKERTEGLFSPSCISNHRLIKAINDINPDIVHIHWNCAGMMSIKDLKLINFPIIWTLHDMWVFTGGCHYSSDCTKYKESCGLCKTLKSKNQFDLSRRKYLKKRKAYSKINTLVINGLSSWICKCAKSSSLLSEKKIINLPNTIDCKVYKPMNKNCARLLWNFSIDKKLVFFGGLGATSDYRKGYDLLQDAIVKLKNKKNIELVVLGSSEPKILPELGMKVHYTGLLHDDLSMVSLLSAVDVVVVPSRQENLSNLIMESMACGTPVAAFDIGGNSDMISHKENGYLAKSLSSKELCHGIEWLIEDGERYMRISKNAIIKVQESFDYPVVIPKYISEYKNIIDS